MENKRISHSVLDPFIIPHIPNLYRAMHIPKRLPPEAIVVTGHLCAIAGAVGFAYSTASPWFALLLAAGVAANHLADMVDGAHARTTGQCRNGGELLDHFFDPLSFAYWMVGLGVACGHIALGVVCVIAIFAQAVLTSIKAKMIGRFTLARLGPTEFKTVLVLFGLTLATLHLTPYAAHTTTVALVFTGVLAALLVGQLIINLIRDVKEVNRDGAQPDTTPWVLDPEHKTDTEPQNAA
ncbi:MAG: CDP-alcohol phosphatidyltransferase family protein [Planctomycetota bacterium]|jgi:phosphatidylglycerophosphate synthase